MNKNRVKKYSIAALFGLCALGIVKSGLIYDGAGLDETPTNFDVYGSYQQTVNHEAFNDSRCWNTLGVTEDDISTRDLEEGRLIAASCYREGVRDQSANILTAIENGFLFHETPEEESQAIRNDALLKEAAERRPDIESIELALQFGADINAVNEQGQNIGDIIAANESYQSTPFKWIALYKLHTEYGLDAKYMDTAKENLWNWLKNRYYAVKDKETMTYLDQFQKAGFNIASLEDPQTGYNLLHMAAERYSDDMFTYIVTNNLPFSTRDKSGKHVLDYAHEVYHEKITDIYKLPYEADSVTYVAQAAIDYARRDCDIRQQLFNGDLPEDFSEDIPKDCLYTAISMRRPVALSLAEQSMLRYGYSEADIQQQKNRIFMERNASSRVQLNDLRFAIENGIDIDTKNEDGKSPIDMILEEESASAYTPYKWLALYELNQSGNLDPAYLETGQQNLWQWFKDSFHWSDTKEAITYLEQMQNTDLDITKLADPQTGYNLLHLAAENRADDLLRHIVTNGYAFPTKDKEGKHVLDYASHAKQSDLAIAYGLDRDTEIVRPLSAEYIAFAGEQCAPEINATLRYNRDIEAGEENILTIDCLNSAMYGKRSKAVSAIVDKMRALGQNEDTITALKTRIFFEKHGSSFAEEDMGFIFSIGLDASSKNEDGQTLLDLLLAQEQSFVSHPTIWELVYNLHTTGEADQELLEAGRNNLWQWFNSSFSRGESEEAVTYIEQMQEAGLDILSLTDPETGRNLMHIAAARYSEELIEYIVTNDIPFPTRDAEGKHVLDHTDFSFQREKLQNMYRLNYGDNLVRRVSAETIAYAAKDCQLGRDWISEDVEPDFSEDLSPDCMDDAMRFKLPVTAALTEAAMKKHGFSDADIQRIKDDTLLTYYSYPSVDGFDFAISIGANIHATNGDGKNIVDLMLEHDHEEKQIRVWDTLYYLHRNHGLDLSGVPDQSARIWNWINSIAPQYFDYHQEDIITQLERLSSVQEIDPMKLTDSATGDNLLHMAAKSEAYSLLKYIFDQGLKLVPTNNDGVHFLDLLPEATKDIVRTSYSQSYSTVYRPRPLIERMRDYFETHGEGETVIYGSGNELDRFISPAADFDMYIPITYDTSAIPDNGIDPAMIVAEWTWLSREQGHIKDTTRTAMGTGQAIGATDWQDTISVKMNPRTHGANSLTQFLLFNTDSDYPIVTHSIGRGYNGFLGMDEPKPPEQTYQEDYAADETGDINIVDQWRFVYYNAAGNNNRENVSCPTIDGISFCMQTPWPAFHPITAVRVGAAKKHDDGSLAVEDYSDNRPAICALIPKDNGEHYAGTSFTSPAAAPVEKRLANIFARSDSFPNGVVHEDILMAMMLTAQANDNIDEKTDDVVPVANNIAGLPMNDRCGAGIINPQAAADLLHSMVSWTTNDSAINPTTPKTDRYLLGSPQVANDDEPITYSFTADNDGILTQIRAYLPFVKENRGAATIQIGNNEPVALDLAPSGLTTDFRFAGYKISAGEEIKIMVTRPLMTSHYSGQINPFIDFRVVQPDSPISKAVEQFSVRP